MEARLPASVSMSLVLHLTGLGGWLYLQHITAKAPMRVISNVDLLIQVRQPVTAIPRPMRAAPRLNTWNFLKMALPSVPKAAVPLEVKEEVRKKTLVEVQDKLKENKSHLQDKAMNDKLVDLGRSRRLAQLDASQVAERRAPRVIAETPKLEEVGSRRTSTARIEMALAAERQGRLEAMDAGTPLEPKTTRRVEAMAALPEAAPQAQPSALRKMADMLTSDMPPLPEARPMPARELSKRVEDTVATPVAPKRTEALTGAKKKAVEIEGPLSNRKVVAYELPQFPQWAADQGVMQAEVKIRFSVSPAGDVLPAMRVELTSGYGALDRLAMDSLRRWRFQPVGEEAGNQWGIITFRFELE